MVNEKWTQTYLDSGILGSGESEIFFTIDYLHRRNGTDMEYFLIINLPPLKGTYNEFPFEILAQVNFQGNKSLSSQGQDTFCIKPREQKTWTNTITYSIGANEEKPYIALRVAEGHVPFSITLSCPEKGWRRQVTGGLDVEPSVTLISLSDSKDLVLTDENNTLGLDFQLASQNATHKIYLETEDMTEVLNTGIDKEMGESGRQGLNYHYDLTASEIKGFLKYFSPGRLAMKGVIKCETYIEVNGINTFYGMKMVEIQMIVEEQKCLPSIEIKVIQSEDNKQIAQILAEKSVVGYFVDLETRKISKETDPQNGSVNLRPLSEYSMLETLSEKKINIVCSSKHSGYEEESLSQLTLIANQGGKESTLEIVNGKSTYDIKDLQCVEDATKLYPYVLFTVRDERGFSANAVFDQYVVRYNVPSLNITQISVGTPDTGTGSQIGCNLNCNGYEFQDLDLSVKDASGQIVTHTFKHCYKIKIKFKGETDFVNTEDPSFQIDQLYSQEKNYTTKEQDIYIFKDSVDSSQDFIHAFIYFNTYFKILFNTKKTYSSGSVVAEVMDGYYYNNLGTIDFEPLNATIISSSSLPASAAPVTIFTNRGMIFTDVNYKIYSGYKTNASDLARFLPVVTTQGEVVPDPSYYGEGTIWIQLKGDE